MSDQKHTDKQKSSRLPSLGKEASRWIAVACGTFWLSIAVLQISRLLSLTPLGLLLLLVLAICSTGIVMYLGITAIESLRVDLGTLAWLAQRDKSDEVVDFEYEEFANVADEIGTSNRLYRDEIEALRLTAFRDSITGLPNRLSLIETIEQRMPDASHEKPCAVFHLILDGFKGTGDVLGVTGNQQLQSDVASRLSFYLATSTGWDEAMVRNLLLASLGAGQFGIFIPAGCDRDHAVELARGLRSMFRKPFEINGRDIMVSVSGGIALAPDDGDTPELLLQNASMALNEILRASKKGFQFFSPRLQRLAVGRARFEQELRDAVSADAFHPVFQPKIDLMTNEIVGVEALARWQHEKGRMISPGTFVPLAEELGLIDEIGFQIMQQSCKAAAAWNAAGMGVSVAVNVSPQQFDRPDFAYKVSQALQVSQLPSHLLELEITETMAVTNPDRVTRVMGPLRAMGIKLAVDDFGTGHANLSLLTEIPFDIFKIDRQFVTKLEDDPQAPAIVEMILSMAKTLGLKTVAEGIETEGQAAFLRERNCSLGQGFLYSRGLLDHEFRTLLSGWPANRRKMQATG